MTKRDGSSGQSTNRPTSASETSGSLTAQAIYELVVRQDFKCALTGWTLEPKDASIDHIVPLAKGGSHTRDNAQVVHTLVNTAKGTLTAEEFIRLCTAVARHRGDRSTDEAQATAA